ncbi:MAG: DUF371 domain-containing protein [Nitrososphaerales archaeon]|nr:DUF371 domain-containing protein [Nitrososphaerales archaeon]
MKVLDTIDFFGHHLIKATHKTTLEVTKEEGLSPRGDCIIGVRANKSCWDLDSRLKMLMANEIPVRNTIQVNDLSFNINAMGNPSLMLTDKRDVVIRKSDYICPRTLAIRSNKAAIDMPRLMILMLKRNDAKGIMSISVDQNLKPSSPIKGTNMQPHTS